MLLNPRDPFFADRANGWLACPHSHFRFNFVANGKEITCLELRRISALVCQAAVRGTKQKGFVLGHVQGNYWYFENRQSDVWTEQFALIRQKKNIKSFFYRHVQKVL
jgi:hypothetical protein